MIAAPPYNTKYLSGGIITEISGFRNYTYRKNTKRMPPEDFLQHPFLTAALSSFPTKYFS